ncbi:hypothetical protein HY256_04520 [Candidatus Sumerlaeota bacterium]|nr:hypothetical protein [Candidatus Sumerlaeota bacterium]
MWKSETLFISSLTEITMHPAYQQIIGMGFAAVPLILKELAAAPNHWFWALTAITGENPASEVAQGRMDEMRDAWLKWGRRYGCSC